jgi:hypothetical protein
MIEEHSDYFKELEVVGNIILKWILKKWCEKIRLNTLGLKRGKAQSCYEHNNESSGWIKGRKFS